MVNERTRMPPIIDGHRKPSLMTPDEVEPSIAYVRLRSATSQLRKQRRASRNVSVRIESFPLPIFVSHSKSFVAFVSRTRQGHSACALATSEVTKLARRRKSGEVFSL